MADVTTRPSAIAFEGVGKKYRLGSGVTSLREAIGRCASRVVSSRSAPAAAEIWALRDIGFELPEGQALGVVGRNGAGKTTLLKLLAGVTRPTVGRIVARGRIGSLIELGAGFHPDLTGRENVFLNGQIMGMSRKTIAARYDEIVEFAGLEAFMGTPVKRYSSGMYARLGFSVAAHMDPDILLVDEVLSVGDAEFQRKSADRMRSLVNSGRTVIFVSHNLVAVERMCDRAMWLDEGRVRALAGSREAIGAYLDSEEQRLLAKAPAPTAGRAMRIDEVTLVSADGRPGGTFTTGRDIEVVVRFTALEDLDRVRFNLCVSRGQGVLFAANMWVDGMSVTRPAGPGSVRCRLRDVPLMPGAYQLYGEVWAAEGYDLIVPWSEWTRFRVVAASLLEPLLDPQGGSNTRDRSPIMVVHEWREEG